MRARRAILEEILGAPQAPVLPTPPPAPPPPAAPPEPARVADAGQEHNEPPESNGGQEQADGAGPVQSGQAKRTREEAREAVRALLGEDLTDREIARRVGVSPSTVAAVRKAST